MAAEVANSKSEAAIKFAKQAQKLSLQAHDVNDNGTNATTAVEARFITPQDPIIETANGGRLPTVPLKEALELNKLRDQVEGRNVETEGRGPGFLGVIVLGAAFTSIPLMFTHIGISLRGKDPNARRPFYEDEKRRAAVRKEQENNWKRQRRRGGGPAKLTDENEEAGRNYDEYEPTEGGKDPLICDAGYYARRVGLDTEGYSVETEDGFIIELLHLYNPKYYTPASLSQRSQHEPIVFAQSSQEADSSGRTSSTSDVKERERKYPVLLVHGLLQSSGAYCANDDDSLAFFLAKSGYDVWLGNNRCGFKPRHALLQPSDPRMWNWNIRQMGVMDLPALISRVLSETGFEKLGLVCHSQGTTETFVALAKEQRPDLGNKISPGAVD
ncbi:lysosomal acid lipase/cholesteryl ester hydrolase, partial [Lecanoromycetidae sp. Uapishka_2]